MTPSAKSHPKQSDISSIFRPWRLGPLEIPNRLMRSATWEGLSTDSGAPTRRLIDLTADLARGRVGLIIAGAAYVQREGRYASRETGMDRDGLIAPLSHLCDAVHRAKGVLAAQLSHVGSSLPPEVVEEKTGPYGPSAVPLDPVCESPVRALCRTQIDDLVEDYARAATRARRAGFDAVQIHAAHGGLLNQFLSPARNRREDAYGGSLPRRARFLYEAYEAVRGAVGPSFPVFVKMSAHDGYAGGVQPVEAALVAAELGRLGIDAIEVSAGTPEGARRGGWDHIMPAPIPEGRFFDYALTIKDAVRCPVISVEGWRDPLRIAEALERIDAVSLCRPFIREPHLAARWRAGDLTPATCISCNKCLDLIVDRGLGCIFHKDARGRAVAGA